MASLDDILSAEQSGQTSYVPQANVPVSAVSVEKLQSKMNAIIAASKAKIARLDEQGAAIRAQSGVLQAQADAYANSWVGKLGLDPESAIGAPVNLLAGVLAGGSRQVVGATAALPHSIVAGLDDASLNAEDTAAYNRYVNKQATPEDMLRLNSHKDVTGSGMAGFSAAKASMSANSGPTVLQLAQQANDSRAVARKINDTFNIDGIEDQRTKEALGESLNDSFKNDLSVMKDAINNFKSGNYGSAATDAVSSLAQMLLHGGEAAVKNPLGAAQYVAENAPQLLVGTLGAAGKAGMTAANIGYAADYYQQGIENFQKENKGALPAPEERARIAAWASSLALAEEAGDRIGLAAMKVKGAAKAITGVGEGAASMPTEIAAKAAAKASLLGSLKNTAVAGAEGAVGETLTEGYQGYAEDVTAGKRAYNDFSDEALANIYQNAAIGGLTGGALSGGVHGISEVVGATPEKAQIRQNAAEKAKIFDESVKNNNPAPFLDTNSVHYDPIQAVQVYAQHNLTEDATPQSRDENVMKAAQLLEQLGEREKELDQQRKSDDPEQAKQAQESFIQVNTQLKQGQVLWNRMFDESQNLNAKETATEQVKQANEPVQNAPQAKVEKAQQAVNTVINLSMASTRHLTADQAAELATNPDNGLNDDQRAFLRTFSEARQAHNAAQDMGKITNTVLNGNKKTGDLGVNDYRSRIGMALATGNQARASYDLGMLTRFATSHVEKAAVAQEGVAKFGKDVQVYKTENGWGYAAPGTYTKSQLRKGGGLYGVAPRLLEALQVEAKVLATTRDEMTQAIQLKFGTTQNTGAAVQSNLTPAAPTTSAAPLVSPASLFREKREREGRVEEGEPSSTLSPLNSLPVVEGNTNPSVGLEQQAETVSSIPSPTSPALQPSAPIVVADAPTQGTAASLASVGSSTQANAASKQEAAVVPSGNNSHEEVDVDTGEGIPRTYWNTPVEHKDVWVSDEAKFDHDGSTKPAHKVLKSIRDEITKLEALASCMKG